MSALNTQHGPNAWRTYVANIDGLASFTVGGGKVGKRIGWDGGSLVASKTASSGAAATAAAAAIATSSTIASTKATATAAEATAAAETTAEASTSTEAAATAAETTSHSGVGEAIDANLEDTALPVVAVELLDRIAGVIGCLEDNNTRALGSSIGSKVDVSTNNTAGAGCWQHAVSIDIACTMSSTILALTCLSKEVLEVLPSDGVGQLRESVSSILFPKGIMEPTLDT